MRLVIPGNPIPKHRHRSFQKEEGGVGSYSDQAGAERKFYLIARQQINQKPLTGPLVFDMVCYIDRPKKHYGTGKNAGKLKPSAPPYPILNNGDWDNYGKFACDALNKLAFLDDRQVVDGFVRKRFADDRLAQTVINIAQIGR